ncbi:hypothetical protein XELAEV_18032606mg [Xenopus laevis]|uniref:Uncharacterized protein n=1 Tax=Xenopus laevis TaxID=8355 RepID=A0A974CHV4_XENLA|nr:hypothetical protein XELAEV_18032606mg [Xenopus laevis]
MYWGSVLEVQCGLQRGNEYYTHHVDLCYGNVALVSRFSEWTFSGDGLGTLKPKNFVFYCLINYCFI